MDLDLDNIVWSVGGNASFVIDVDTDFTGWVTVQNVGSTRYNNSYTASDNKVDSSDYITVHVNIEEALSAPVVPANTTLYVSDIGTLTCSVNKASATMTIIDDNITLNGNALAFKTTATKLEGQHTITVSAKNIYNGIVETQTSVAFVITSIVKVTQKTQRR